MPAKLKIKYGTQYSYCMEKAKAFAIPNLNVYYQLM